MFGTSPCPVELATKVVSGEAALDPMDDLPRLVIIKSSVSKSFVKARKRTLESYKSISRDERRLLSFVQCSFCYSDYLDRRSTYKPLHQSFLHTAEPKLSHLVVSHIIGVYPID